MLLFNNDKYCLLVLCAIVAFSTAQSMPTTNDPENDFTIGMLMQSLDNPKGCKQTCVLKGSCPRANDGRPSDQTLWNCVTCVLSCSNMRQCFIDYYHVSQQDLAVGIFFLLSDLYGSCRQAQLTASCQKPPLLAAVQAMGVDKLGAFMSQQQGCPNFRAQIPLEGSFKNTICSYIQCFYDKVLSDHACVRGKQVLEDTYKLMSSLLSCKPNTQQQNNNNLSQAKNLFSFFG